MPPHLYSLEFELCLFSVIVTIHLNSGIIKSKLKINDDFPCSRVAIQSLLQTPVPGTSFLSSFNPKKLTCAFYCNYTEKTLLIVFGVIAVLNKSSAFLLQDLLHPNWMVFSHLPTVPLPSDQYYQVTCFENSTLLRYTKSIIIRRCTHN